MPEHEYKIVGGGQEDDPDIAEKMEEAEEEIGEARVNGRFGREQLDMVRRAAALRGIPYQIYIKDAVYERAFDDLSARLEYDALRRALSSPAADDETRRLRESLGATRPAARKGQR